MQRSQYTPAYPVLEIVGMGDQNPMLFRKANDGAAKWMLRIALGTGRRLENRLLGDVRCNIDLGDERYPVGQRSRLVDKNSIQVPQCFKINTALDNRPLPCGASDRTEDGKRSARCDATRSSYNDNRDRRPDVVRDEKGEHRSAEREVNEIACKPVRRLLDGRA